MLFIGLDCSYSEFKLNNIIKLDDPSKFFEIQSKHNKSYYEILPNIIKPFFDIENVDNESKINDLIQIIKNRFKEYFDFDVSYYILTKNEHSSHHSGLSYHLIIQDCKIEMNLLKRFVKNELNMFNIVDSSIYTKNRLFRTIDSYGITKNNTKDLNSIHKLYKIFKDNNEIDFSIEFNKYKYDSLISNIFNINHEIKLNKKYEDKWLLKENTNKKPLIIRTWSQNSINLSNIDIINGNLIVPLSNKLINKNQLNEDIEKILYDKIIVLLEFNLNEISKNKLLDMKSYYETNKSFKEYKLELNQIRYMISLIEKSIIKESH